MGKRVMTVLAMTVVIAGLQAVATAEAQKDGVKPGLQTMDLDAAKALAAEKKLPILLNFSGSDWCGWCKLMEKNVFSQEAWQTFAAANVVTVLLDYPNDKSLVPEKYVERNEKLKEQFGVSGFPTFILLDADGVSKLGQLGAGQDKTPESFAAEIQGLTRYRTASIAAYAKSLKPADAAAYRKLVDAMREAEGEIKKQESIMEAAGERLEALTEELDQTKVAARDFRAAQLGEDAAAAYKKLKQDRDAATDELEAWLATKPEKSRETMEKFKALSGKVQELEGQLSEF